MENVKINNWDGNINRFKDFPSDHALKAYEEEYYVEAVVVLHGFLESQLRENLLAFTSRLKILPEKVWDTNEKLDFRNLSNILFILQLIDDNQVGVLNGINSLRNEIVHKYFFEPYNEAYCGVSNKKFASVFKPAYNLSFKLLEKIEDMYSEVDTVEE